MLYILKYMKCIYAFFSSKKGHNKDTVRNRFSCSFNTNND